MNHLQKKNRKIAKKLRQQEKKKAFAKESNETDENNSETETFSAVENPYETALEDSDKNTARETNNIKGFEDDAIHDDDQNEDLHKFKKTDDVLEMSSFELSQFLEEIVENHIKSRRKIDPD
jgi:hypothetical protein